MFSLVVNELHTLIAGFVIVRAAVKLVSECYVLFYRQGLDLTTFGKWAVVTGATDGIGKAYAIGLAEKGIDVVLISRTEAKLEEVKKEIEDKGYGVKVKYIVCDYSKFDEKAKANVKKGLKGVQVGILINNVRISRFKVN